MKKSFFIGLLLVSVVLGFAGCKQPTNGPVVTEKKVKAVILGNSDFIEFTEEYVDGKFSRCVMNKAAFMGISCEINAKCSCYKNNEIFDWNKGSTEKPEMHKLTWENGCNWYVDCPEGKFKLSGTNNFVTGIEFGSCVCDGGELPNQFYIKFWTDKPGTETDTVVVYGTVAIPEEVKHFIATTKEGLSIDFTARYQGENNPVKVILNKISENNTEINVNENCIYGVASISFPEGSFKISDKTVKNLKWENDKSWNLECAYDWNGGQLAGVYFGWCTCSIDNKEEKIFVIDTKIRGDGIGGDSYIATLKEVK